MFLYVDIFSSEKDSGGIEGIVSHILQSSNYQTLVKFVSSDKICNPIFSIARYLYG